MAYKVKTILQSILDSVLDALCFLLGQEECDFIVLARHCEVQVLYVLQHQNAFDESMQWWC